MNRFFFSAGICLGVIFCFHSAVLGVMDSDWNQDFEIFEVGSLPGGNGINVWSENNSNGGVPCSSSNLQLNIQEVEAFQGSRFLRFEYNFDVDCYAELDFHIDPLSIHTLEFYCRKSNPDHNLTVRVKQDDGVVFQYRVPYAPFLNTGVSDWSLVRINLHDLWYSYNERTTSGSNIVRIGLLLSDGLSDEQLSGWFDIDSISVYTENPTPYLNWAKNRNESTENENFNLTWGICTNIRALSPDPNGDFNPQIINNDGQVISSGLLDDVERLGFHWIRDNKEWQNIEPELGEFDFSWESHYQDELDSRGIGRIYVLGYGHPGYYQELGQNQYYPQGEPEVDVEWKQRFIGIVKQSYRDAFCNYASNVATEFQDRDRLIYEIWNEPDNSNFWKPEDLSLDARGRDYRRLASEAADAIVEVQPDAQVFFGASSRHIPSFSKTVSDSLGNFLNGWSNHFYRWLPNLDWDESRNPSFLNHPEGMIGDVEWLRRLFYRQGQPELSIICTEMGYNDNSIDPGPNSIFGLEDLSPEECDMLEARYVVRTQLTNAFLKMPVMAHFALTGGVNDSFEEFSLIALTEKKPSYYALERLNGFVGDKRLICPIDMPYADLYGLLFKGSGVTTGVLWHSRRNASDTLILQRYDGLIVNDMWGNTIPVEPLDDDPSCFELVLSEEMGPVFLSMPISASQIDSPLGSIVLSSSCTEIVSSIQDVQPFQLFTFSLLVDFSEVNGASLSGWECSINVPNGVYITSAQLENVQLNFGDDNNFIVTVDPVISTSGLEILATFQAVIVDPAGIQNGLISIGPSDPSSFSGFPGWLNDDGLLFSFETTWQEHSLLINPGSNSGEDLVPPYLNSARLRWPEGGEQGQVVCEMVFNEPIDLSNSSFSAFRTNTSEEFEVVGNSLDESLLRLFLSGNNIEFIPISVVITLLEDLSGNVKNNIEIDFPMLDSIPKIFITEIMQQPTDGSFIYLEVFNAGIVPISLAGWELNLGENSFEIVENSWLNVGEIGCIVKNALPFPVGMTHPAVNVITEIEDLAFNEGTIELIDPLTGMSSCSVDLPFPSMSGASFEVYWGADPTIMENWYLSHTQFFQVT